MTPINSETNACTLDPVAVKAYCKACKDDHWKTSCWQCTLKQIQMVSYITTFGIDGISDATEAVFAVRDHSASKAKNRWLKRGAIDVCGLPKAG